MWSSWPCVRKTPSIRSPRSTERSGAIRSIPGKLSSGKETPTSTRMLEPPAAQPEDVAAELADAAERNDLERRRHSGAANRWASARKVLERQLLGARARRLVRALRGPSPSAARGAAEDSALASVLRRALNPSEARHSARRIELRSSRAARAASARGRSRRPSAAGGRRRAAGRRGCAPSRARRRAPRGSRRRRLRGGRRTGARPRAARSPRTARIVSGASIAARRMGVAALYGRLATSTAGPSHPAAASHSRKGRCSTSPANTNTRSLPTNSSARAAARSGSISTATTARARSAERAGQRPVARGPTSKTMSSCPTRAASTMRSAVAGAGEKVLSPALAGGRTGPARAGPSVML